MKAFWTRMRGRKTETNDASAAPGLTQLLSAYPPNTSRPLGDLAGLDDADRQDRFERFLPERPLRLQIVSDFLGEQGLDPSPMLDPDGDGVGAARAVDRWLDGILPLRPMTILGDEHPNPPIVRFRASDRAGGDIAFSLIADLALLEDEAIRIRDERFVWSVNGLPGFRDMPNWHQICLIKPGMPGWEATVLDLPEHLLAICHTKGLPHAGPGGHFYGELLDGAVRRAFDPW